MKEQKGSCDPGEGSDPRWITHVTIVAVNGFDRNEVAACHALRRLKGNDESLELRVQRVGRGNRPNFRARRLDEAIVRVSAVPFLTTRSSKTRGTKRDRSEDYASPQAFVRHVLRQELQRRSDLPPVASIAKEEFLGVHGLRAIEFRRARKAGRRWRPSANGCVPYYIHGSRWWPAVPGPYVPPSRSSRERSRGESH